MDDLSLSSPQAKEIFIYCVQAEEVVPAAAAEGGGGDDMFAEDMFADDFAGTGNKLIAKQVINILIKQKLNKGTQKENENIDDDK